MSLQVEPSSKPKPTSLPMEKQYPLEVASNSKINNSNNSSTTQEQLLFLDNRFGTSHDSSITSCRTSDMVGGYFSFYGPNNMGLTTANPNTSLCYIPSSTFSSHMMSSELNSSITSTMLQSMSSTIFPTSTTHVIKTNPSSISSCDNNIDGVLQNWEASTFSNNNNGSKDADDHVHVASLQEDMKWCECEYLNNTPFLGNMNTVQQYQTSQCFYNDEVKPETGIITDHESSTSWNHSQQHQSVFKQSDIYTKDLQRFSVAFGETL